MALGALLAEVVGQQREVLEPLPQRRQLHRHDRQPVVEVLAEAPLLHPLLQLAVGGGDDAHVHRPLLVGADRDHGAVLEHPQQLGLGRQRHVADLVQEQGAAVGELELALLGGVGAGEGALDVAEELGLDQGLRQGGAIDGDEAPPRAFREPVQGARHQLLAGAGLAQDQHRGVGRRGLPHQLEDLGHGRRAADHPLEPEAALELLAQRLVVLREAPLLQLPGHAGPQLDDVDGLGQVVRRALPHRQHRGLDAAVAGDQEHRQLGLQAPRLAQQVEAVAVAEPQVGDHQVEAARPQPVEGGVHRGRHLGLVVLGLQSQAQRLAVGFVVLDDQDPGGLVAHAGSFSGRAAAAASGRRIWARVPWPGLLSSSTEPPWASMMRRTVGRPRPEPPFLREK